MQISEHIENLLMNIGVRKKKLIKNIDLEIHLFMSFYLKMGQTNFGLNLVR